MSASEHNKYALVIAVVATAAALLMVLLFYQFQNLVANAGDPYEYGKIARGFVEHGFTKLTRRAASLYPEFIAVVYRLGGSNYVMILLQCLFHAATCVLVFLLGLRIYNARTGLLAGFFCAFHPMLLRYVPDLHMESFLTLMCTLTIWTTVPSLAGLTIAERHELRRLLEKSVEAPGPGASADEATRGA